MVDPNHPRISIVRQCRLVSVARSSFYDAGTGESPLTLRLMRLIDEQCLETPFYGSRQMTRWLRRQGDRVSRTRVRRLMRLLGVHALYQRPRTSQPHPAHRLSLPAARSADHAAEPRVVHGCYRHPPAAGLSVPGRRDGLGEPHGAVLAPVQHARCPLLRRGVARGERLWRSLTYECVSLSECATGSQARTGIGGWMDCYDRCRPHSSLNDRTPDEAYTNDGADTSPGLRPVSCQPHVA